MIETTITVQGSTRETIQGLLRRMLESGAVDTAWVYFYNAPLGQGQRIESGDYLDHLRVK